MLNWSQPRFVEVPTITDELGSLGVVEGDAPFPFPIRRVYFIHSVAPGAVRGSHAHKELRQLIVAVSGSFTVTLDDGLSESLWFLDSPQKGLVVPPGYWRTLSGFTAGAAALVFASEEYDPADYIRDYDEFLAWTRNG